MYRTSSAWRNGCYSLLTILLHDAHNNTATPTPSSGYLFIKRGFLYIPNLYYPAGRVTLQRERRRNDPGVMAPEIERGQSMTAQQTTQYESKEATNSIQIDVADRINRRWDEADYEIENVDEWDSMGRGMFKVGDFEPSKLRYNGRFESFQWAVNDEQFDRRLFRVKYDELGVACIPDGDGEFDEASAMIRFNADEAKELAAAIWQAAEEYELRREQR